MAEVDNIKEMNHGQQDCEEVEVIEIDVDEEIVDHKVDMEINKFLGDEKEVKGYNKLKIRKYCGDEGESEPEDFADSETEHFADFGTEDIAYSETGDSIDSEEVETEIVNPGYLSPRKKEIIKEESYIESEELNAFVCNYCGHDFAKKGNLRRHEKKFHPHEVTLNSIQFEAMQKCPPKKNFCGDVEWKSYRTESECGKPKCIKCGNKFSCLQNLKLHVLNIHMVISMAKCIECGKEFSSAQKLTHHLRNVHWELPKKKRYKGHPDWKPYRSESELGQPKCKKCGKEYSCARNLKMHVRSVHILKGLKPTESSGKIPVANTAERTCLVCRKIFNKKSDMIKHLVRHTKIYKNLNVEGKTLRSQDGTSATCLECGKWDGKASNLKQHIAQVHFKLCDVIDFDNMESYDLPDTGTMLKGDGRVKKTRI